MLKTVKVIAFFLISVFSPFANAQTYKIEKIEITCKAKALAGELNSDKSEFSPFVFENKIYFASDRSPDKLIFGENNWKRKGVVNIYEAKITGEEFNEKSSFKKARLVSERLTGSSHTGPASFSLSGDTLFISQVRSERKRSVLKPQLFLTTHYNKRWTKLKALPFNNPDYSFGHPSYDSENRRLYFCSDKPDGKGGKDIYYSDLTDKGWGTPVAVNEINTSEDEMFPFFKDGILFFASNTKGTKGGLDVFWMQLDGNEEQEAQPLDGLNTDQDEFGFFSFDEMNKGYFSSNRNGQDDLFFHEMKKTTIIRNEMAGQFQFKSIDGIPKGIRVQILGEDDFVLYETETDEKGNFTFKSIDYDGNYSLKALSEEELELFLLNKNGENTASYQSNERNIFTYRKIAGENSGTLSLISEDMIDFVLNEGYLSGQLIYEDKPGELASNLKVKLVNGEGEEKLSTYTDKNGNFDFKKLSLKENYLLQIPEGESGIVLLIYDLKGNVVAQLKTDDKGQFAFRKLNPDFTNELELKEEVFLAFDFNTQPIWGYFEYDNNKSLSREGFNVSAYSEDGQLLERQVTDDKGTFRFKNLPLSKSILFKLEETGENFVLDDFTLYIYDRDRKKIAGLKRGQDGFFTYRPLGYDLDNELSQIEEENIDFILGNQASNKKSIALYFNSNQSKVKKEDLKILNNIFEVMQKSPTIRAEINAYADARSSDEYNLILSGDRGDWIVQYLIKKGIAKNRFIVNAYGESRLVDETNDALNRRAEIHLY